MSLFGLFSSHIPYIIIGVMYMLYLGGNLLNRNKNTQEPVFLSENIIIAETPDLEKKSGNIDFEEAADYSVCQDYAINDRQNPDLNPFDFSPGPYEEHTLFYCHRFLVSFFSRPPPAPAWEV